MSDLVYFEPCLSRRLVNSLISEVVCNVNIYITMLHRINNAEAGESLGILGQLSQSSKFQAMLYDIVKHC